MSGQVVDQYAPSLALINRWVARLCTFMLAAIASASITMSAYLEAMRDTRVGVVIVGLIGLHAIWHARFHWQREFTLYAYFVAYLFIALLWTRDTELATNTLVPATNFMLVMFFFGSLIRFHNIPTVLLGALCGFAIGAAAYTITQGFPFSYPEVFSYNAIASMYLFGLFVTLMYNCFSRSLGFVLIAVAIVIMLHIVATTSIKANLGIALGLVSAAVMYFRYFGRLLRRRALTLVILACALGFAVASNDILIEKMNRGSQRVLVGVKVLQSREDVAGYSGFDERSYWKQMGIEGWELNPVFGYGTEAFRHDYGITSHSTPVDLLYNYGVIGLILFYGMYVSMLWRIIQVSGRHVSGERSLIFGGIVCYVFVSLSGTMHYNIFLAAFTGIGASLLTTRGGAASTDSSRARAARSSATPLNGGRSA
jgi:hypothetical protein